MYCKTGQPCIAGDKTGQPCIAFPYAEAAKRTAEDDLQKMEKASAAYCVSIERKGPSLRTGLKSYLGKQRYDF